MTAPSSADVMRGLLRLDALARAANVAVDAAVHGGHATIVASDARVRTRDVDAALGTGAGFLAEAAARVAEAEGLPADWLEAGVIGLASIDAAAATRGFPGAPAGGLRVFPTTPEYLLAMACMAARADPYATSEGDARVATLSALAGIADAAAALEVVASFYPDGVVPTGVAAAVEGAMDGAMDGATGLRVPR